MTVLCIIPGCEVKTGNKEGIRLFCIPIIVDKNGEKYKILTEDRRNAWISQICRDHTKSKDIFKSERVCGITFFLANLLYSGNNPTLAGSPDLTWVKRIIQKSPVFRLRQREPTGQKTATKRGSECQQLVKSVENLGKTSWLQ